MNSENPDNTYGSDIVLAFVVFFICLLLALMTSSDTLSHWVGL
jgi:hypothetical protein